MTSLQLKPYQLDGARWMLSRDYGAILADLGMGKTVITLTWLQTLLHLGQLRRCLIIAPLRVCRYVWPAEVQKFPIFWRLAPSLKFDPANYVHLINPESLHTVPDWTAYDTLVVDESVTFKRRFAPKRAKQKALEAIAENPELAAHRGKCRFEILEPYLGLFKRRFILTGGPTPHSLMDLWTQMYICDLGKRLGHNISWFRSRYFERGGFKGKKYLPKYGASDEIHHVIGDMCLRLDRKDHLDLPELRQNNVPVHLPDKVFKAYKNYERKLWFALNDVELTSFNRLEMYSKCRQFASGFVYEKLETGEKKTHWVHREKIKALKELHEHIGHAPLLVLYEHEAEGLELERVFRAPRICGGTTKKQTESALKRWNSKQLSMLIAQTGTVAMGLNLQTGGRDMVFFSLPNNYNNYFQVCGRLYRPGVDGAVTISHLVAARTIDDQALLPSLRDKETTQEGLLDALKAYLAESYS